MSETLLIKLYYLFKKCSKLISHPVPTVKLTNYPQSFVKSGGNIDLTCTVTSVTSVNEVSWFHNGTAIESDLPEWQSKNRSCVTRESQNCAIETKISLRIENVGLSDSGNYTCSPLSDNLEPANVSIEVIDRKCHAVN